MRSKRWDGKSGCAVEVTLSVIGGVWKPIILFHLMTGKRRFMELTRRVPNATQSMLTSQLRELEADGVVIRHVYRKCRRRWNTASEFGRTLVPVLLAMREWGETSRPWKHGRRLPGLKTLPVPLAAHSRPDALALARNTDGLNDTTVAAGAMPLAGGASRVLRSSFG